MENQHVVTTAHNYGFFSNCTVALCTINNYIKHTSHTPVLNMSEDFKWYTNDTDVNMYELCYKQKYDIPIQPFDLDINDSETCIITKGSNRRDAFYVAHRKYINTYISKYKSMVNRYFQPSDYILQLKNKLLSKYNIQTDKTLVICHRGTDKHVEVPVVPYAEYTNHAKKIMQDRHDITQVLVQTDQTQFVEHCKNTLTDYNIIQITDLPTTEKSTQLANHVSDKIQLSTTFLATLLILSECKYIINHTGNVGFWLALYRGNCDNMLQMLPK